LHADGVSDSKQLLLSTGLDASASQSAVTGVKIVKREVSSFVPSAAERMLQELEEPSAESKSLTDLFLKLGHISDINGNCSSVVSCDADCKTMEDDIYTLEKSHCTERQKSGHAQERITKLKENSQKMVSMFIPADAPKLSFSNNVVGECRS